jgi:hypothetical protein
MIISPNLGIMLKKQSSEYQLYEFVDLLGFWFEIKVYEDIGPKDSKS